MRGHHSLRGFSLIEVSILLSILALVLTAALGWLAPAGREDAFKAEETKTKLEDIQQAIRAFRVNHGRLPCPAKRDENDNYARLGEEDCRTNGSNVNRGIVPVKALGISPDYLVDGWGRRFTYQVAVPLCARNATAETLPLLCTAIRYDAPPAEVVGTSEYLELRTTNPNNPGPAPVANGRDVSVLLAYAVISHGSNGYGAWLPSGSQRMGLTGGAPPKEAINVAEDKELWTDSVSREFDDILIYDTKDTIEASTRDYERWVMTLQQCQQNVTNVLGIMSAAEFTSMNDGLFGVGNNMFSSIRPSGQALLSILWHAQELCVRYYPYYYDRASRIKCPGVDADPAGDGQLVLDTALGLTTESALDNNRGHCVCSAGTFNNVTGQCSP